MLTTRRGQVCFDEVVVLYGDPLHSFESTIRRFLCGNYFVKNYRVRPTHQSGSFPHRPIPWYAPPKAESSHSAPHECGKRPPVELEDRQGPAPTRVPRRHRLFFTRSTRRSGMTAYLESWLGAFKAKDAWPKMRHPASVDASGALGGKTPAQAARVDRGPLRDAVRRSLRRTRTHRGSLRPRPRALRRARGQGKLLGGGARHVGWRVRCYQGDVADRRVRELPAGRPRRRRLGGPGDTRPSPRQ